MQLKENDMFLEKPKVDMETAYGLHYPGEVLERIGEHLTLTKQTYRALGLALARMMPLQETCMFNGAQKDLFWKKMKQILGEKDLFLISINYICEEKEKNRWKGIVIPSSASTVPVTAGSSLPKVIFPVILVGNT